MSDQGDKGQIASHRDQSFKRPWAVILSRVSWALEGKPHCTSMETVWYQAASPIQKESKHSRNDRIVSRNRLDLLYLLIAVK
jgi:hypothetical protein